MSPGPCTDRGNKLHHGILEEEEQDGKDEEEEEKKMRKENTLNSAPDDISAGANRCLVKQMHKTYEMLQTVVLTIIMDMSHVLIDTLSTHMMHADLNTIF